MVWSVYDLLVCTSGGLQQSAAEQLRGLQQVCRVARTAHAAICSNSTRRLGQIVFAERHSDAAPQAKPARELAEAIGDICESYARPRVRSVEAAFALHAFGRIASAVGVS